MAMAPSTATNPNNDFDLLPLLRRAVPTVTSYEALGTVTQANAEGVRVLARHANDDGHPSRSTTELFVKQVDASHYGHKPWGDLRRTLLYARTEARFYGEILPRLRSGGGLAGPALAPACHLAECNLGGLVGEEELATDVSHVLASAPGSITAGDCIPLDLLRGRGGALVLDSLGGGNYVQESPLTPTQASRCLAAVARLHASAWEDANVLRVVSDRLSESGGSYHLRIRNPKEHANLVASWDKFVENFRHLRPDLFERDGVRNIGRRVYDLAEYVSQELSPRFDDPHATIVHGDYKSMNVFLPVDQSDDDGGAVVIDFASTGVGLGMSDVAMHLTHALRPTDLEGGGDERLVEEYLRSLDRARRVGREGPVDPYPREVALRHYRLATVDYFRFILGRFWRSASPESFEKKKNSPNTTLVNRDVDAAMAFVERVEGYLEEFEEERREADESYGAKPHRLE